MKMEASSSSGRANLMDLSTASSWPDDPDEHSGLSDLLEESAWDNFNQADTTQANGAFSSNTSNSYGQMFASLGELSFSRCWQTPTRPPSRDMRDKS
jgi:hypothetical protein